MRVANDNELTTSATLGGQTAIAFGISDDPAFFHVLSTSLYNNPNLAVVRETICNQWDAHIEAGKQHIPVLITIDEDNFISFRDYGKGIPSENIGAVYGTYGASTKKSNSNVTGGFGLGCKSPFAYTDSFQVTSWNQSKMSVYNVTKSSVETDGKPGIIPIITDALTEDSGLEVKFQLEKNDVSEFVQYIKSIVFNGEIKAVLRMPALSLPDDKGNREVKLTDTVLPVMGMSFEPGSYDMADGWYKPYMGNSAVYIRYGNVMYPAVQSPATEEALGIIHNFMNIIGANRIVVQAAPSTLAIAPSRETLSNQGMTDDGIVDICVDLVNRLEKEIKEGIPKAIKQVVDGIKTSNQFSWIYYENFTDYISNSQVNGYMRSGMWRKAYTHHLKQWKNLSIKRFFEQSEFGGINLNFNKAKLALHECRNRHSTKPLAEHLQRNVVIPRLAKWKLAGLKWNGHVISESGCRLEKNNLSYSLLRLTSLSVLQTITTKNVIVTKRLSDVHDSFTYHPDYCGLRWRELCNADPGHKAKRTAHVIHVGAKSGEAEAAVTKYTALGYNVIDLTQNHDWDVVSSARREATAQAAAQRARNKATKLAAGMEGSEPNRLVSISCLLGLRNGVNWDKKIYTYPYIHSDFANPENWKRNNHIDVENPVYYVLLKDVRYGQPTNKVSIGSMHTWNELTDEVKSVTIVCRNKIEQNKAIKRGAVHLDDKRYMELMDTIKTKEFKKYVTEQRESILVELGMEDGDYQKLLKLLGIKNKVLDSLVNKPEYEWAYKFLSNSNYSDKMKLISLGCIENVDELNPYIRLTHFTSFKPLQALYDIKGIFYSDGVGGPLYNTTCYSLLDWLDRNPEDIPGYKTIIRNCLTKRKGKYTR